MRGSPSRLSRWRCSAIRAAWPTCSPFRRTRFPATPWPRYSDWPAWARASEAWSSPSSRDGWWTTTLTRRRSSDSASCRWCAPRFCGCFLVRCGRKGSASERPALALHRSGTPGAGHEEVLPPKLALVHHAQPVLATAQVVRAGVIGSEAELAAGFLRHTDERRAGQAIAIIELDSHSVARGGADHLLHPFLGPEPVVIF